MKETILNILADITGDEDVKTNLDMNLFETGILDSMGTVQLILEIQTQLGIDIPVSEFVREDWATPNMIIDQVAKLQ